MSQGLARIAEDDGHRWLLQPVQQGCGRCVRCSRGVSSNTGEDRGMTEVESIGIFQDSISWAKGMGERIKIARGHARDYTSSHALDELWNFVLTVQSIAERNLDSMTSYGKNLPLNKGKGEAEE